MAGINIFTKISTTRGYDHVTNINGHIKGKQTKIITMYLIKYFAIEV